METRVRIIPTFFASALMLAALALAQSACARYVPVDKYDPMRSAAKDLEDASAEGRRTGKRILVEVGGEWCKWCHILDRFFQDNPGLVRLREANFVMVKINFSDENLNEEFLGRFPPIPGYPHFFVLDSTGKLLHSQDTAKLEEGEGYNVGKFTTFLEEWRPGRPVPPPR